MKKDKKEGRLSAKYLITAGISFLIIIFFLYQKQINPTYQTDIIIDDKVIWQIKGNTRSLSISSTNIKLDESIGNKFSLEIKSKNNNKNLKIGNIPNAGTEKKFRLPLPETWDIQYGDNVLIFENKNKTTGKLITQSVLNKI